MICRSCLRAASRAQIQPRTYTSTSRAFTTAPTLLNTTSTSSRTPPPATSTSAAQPFSEAITPAAKKDGNPAAPEKKAPLIRSSVPAGTPLKGLNFLKDRQDPVALPDEEYPEWLWSILERQEQKGESAAAGDLFCKLTYRLIPYTSTTFSFHAINVSLLAAFTDYPAQRNPRNNVVSLQSVSAKSKPPTQGC